MTGTGTARRRTGRGIGRGIGRRTGRRTGRGTVGRIARVLAVALAVTAPAGCTGGGAPPPGTASALAPNSTIAWALDQQPRQYNPNTVQGDTPANAAVLSGVLGAFWRYRPDGTVERTTDFGSFRKISDDPLTVQYTIDSRAVWSDGVPIDCDDVALAWLASSGVTGERGFAALDVARYRDMNRPKCQSGDKVVTISYRTPLADWQTAFGPGSAWLLPAHVVRREAGLPKSFVDYLDTPQSPDLARAAAFWNTGWAFTAGQVRKDLVLSSGPYLIDSWQAGASITLKANPRWWGHPPVTGTIVIRFASPQDQVQALAAGRIQAMAPDPDPDVVSALKRLGKRVRVVTGDRYVFEHLDFNLRGEFADASLREAFARCVPRQRIVDQVVRPLAAGSRVLQSRFVMPFQPGYPDFAAAGHPYDTVDLAAARRLLAGRRPTVRIGWRKDPEVPDPARVQTLSLLKASCAQAGFTVLDAGTPTFLDRELRAGSYDVAMFSWMGSPTVTGSTDMYISGGASNLGHYADRDVDGLIARLARQLDPRRQGDLLRQIDAVLWKDVATVPLFAYPALAATTLDVSGISYNPTILGLGWNVAEWHRS